MGNGESAMNEEEAKEIASQTDFQYDEIQKAYEEFLKDYPDGKMTQAQLETVYKKLSPGRYIIWMNS